MFKKAFLLCLLCFSISTVTQLSARARDLELNVGAAPAVIRVPDDYLTIQEAISQANPGDTVRVSPGTYNETLFINKTLTLIGEDRDTTLLNGNREEVVVQANITSVTISGFTIINGTEGIVLENCSGSTVKENKVKCFRLGIWLHYSNSNTVSDNIVLNSGWCGIVLCGGSSENNVTGNTLKNNGNGLGLTGTNNIIYHNNFIANQNQTQMDSSHRNVWNNSYEGNYWSDYNGTDFDTYGIGSIPYAIDPDNQDNYPLKSPYMIGDVNHDAKVNILDINIIARAFWTVPGDGRWNLHADIDGNNEINIADISKPAESFGKEWKDPL